MKFTIDTTTPLASLQLEGCCETDWPVQWLNGMRVNEFVFPCGLRVQVECAYERIPIAEGHAIHDCHMRHHEECHVPEFDGYWPLVCIDNQDGTYTAVCCGDIE